MEGFREAGGPVDFLQPPSVRTTRRRRQAGPPPFCMLWRRGARRASRTGFSPARISSTIPRAPGSASHSAGARRHIPPPGRLTNWLLNRYVRAASARDTLPGGVPMGSSSPPQAASPRFISSRAVSPSAKASAWWRGTFSFAAAMASLWNAPASLP